LKTLAVVLHEFVIESANVVA